MLPDHPPRNLDFQIDDLNARFGLQNCQRPVQQLANSRGRFTFPANSFDLVHSQMVAGGIHASRWPSYVRDIYRVTKPGGWCQIVEMYLNAQSDNGRLTYGKYLGMGDSRKWRVLMCRGCADHALSKWSSRYLNTLSPRKNPRAALSMAGWMENAGFVDIESKLITLPMSAWSTGMKPERSVSGTKLTMIRQSLETKG